MCVSYNVFCVFKMAANDNIHQLFVYYIYNTKFVGCNYFSKINIAHNLMCREKLICAKSGYRTLCTLYIVHVYNCVAYYYRYSYGFGVIELVLGKDHFLNQPNSYYGVIFYPIQFILGKNMVIECTPLQFCNFIQKNG